MKITGIDLYPLNIPFKPERVMKVSYGVISGIENVVIAIHTNEDLTGWGEAAPLLPFNGESQDSVMRFLKVFSKQLINQDPAGIGRIIDLLDTVTGNLAAKAAIDFALYDLLGKAAHMPVYRLFGGPRALEAPMHATVPIREPHEMAAEAKKWVDAGFGMLEFKLGRVGGDVDIDMEVQRVKSVREAVGGRVKLVADANTGWNLSSALAVLRRIQDLDVYVEQPAKDIPGLARIKKAVSVPIIADESCQSPGNVMELIRQDAADLVSVKPVKVGGLSKAAQIIAIAEAAGLGYRYDTHVSTRLACTASLHLALSTSNQIGGGFTHYTRQARDIVRSGGLKLDGGTARLEDPDAPGFGVELDLAGLGNPIRIE